MLRSSRINIGRALCLLLALALALQLQQESVDGARCAKPENLENGIIWQRRNFIRFRCLPTFMLMGNAMLTCGLSGRLSGERPFCASEYQARCLTIDRTFYIHIYISLISVPTLRRVWLRTAARSGQRPHRDTARPARSCHVQRRLRGGRKRYRLLQRTQLGSRAGQLSASQSYAESRLRL